MQKYNHFLGVFRFYPRISLKEYVLLHILLIIKHAPSDKVKAKKVDIANT